MTPAGPDAPDAVRAAAWAALAVASTTFYALGPAARRSTGPGWFVAASGVDHGELNVAGLGPGTGSAQAAAVGAALGADLPAIVFVSAQARDGVTDPLREQGFALAPEPEPVMALREPPAATDGGFACRPALADAERDVALALTAHGHSVPAPLLDAAARPALADPGVVPWLAYDGDEPVSVVWVVRAGPALVVKEMMTPPRHQRRGAGRAVLSTALAGSWDDATELAVLVSTVAGQRLYGSVGFEVVDPQVTAFRGADEEVLAAIGLVPRP